MCIYIYVYIYKCNVYICVYMSDERFKSILKNNIFIYKCKFIKKCHIQTTQFSKRR